VKVRSEQGLPHTSHHLYWQPEIKLWSFSEETPWLQWEAGNRSNMGKACVWKKLENSPWTCEFRRKNEKRKWETWWNSEGCLRGARMDVWGDLGGSNLGGQEGRGGRKWNTSRCQGSKEGVWRWGSERTVRDRQCVSHVDRVCNWSCYSRVSQYFFF